MLRKFERTVSRPGFDQAWWQAGYTFLGEMSMGIVVEPAGDKMLDIVHLTENVKVVEND